MPYQSIFSGGNSPSSGRKVASDRDFSSDFHPGQYAKINSEIAQKQVKQQPVQQPVKQNGFQGFLSNAGNFLGGIANSAVGTLERGVGNTGNLIAGAVSGEGFNVPKAKEQTQSFLKRTGQIDKKGNINPLHLNQDDQAVKLGQSVGSLPEEIVKSGVNAAGNTLGNVYSLADTSIKQGKANNAIAAGKSQLKYIDQLENQGKLSHQEAQKKRQDITRKVNSVAGEASSALKISNQIDTKQAAADASNTVLLGLGGSTKAVGSIAEKAVPDVIKGLTGTQVGKFLDTLTGDALFGAGSSIASTLQQNPNASQSDLLEAAKAGLALGAGAKVVGTAAGKVPGLLGKKTNEVSSPKPAKGIFARANKDAADNAPPISSESGQISTDILPGLFKGSPLTKRAIANVQENVDNVPEPTPQLLPTAEPVVQPHMMSPEEQTTLKSLNSESKTRVLTPEEKATRESLQAKNSAITEANKPTIDIGTEKTQRIASKNGEADIKDLSKKAANSLENDTKGIKEGAVERAKQEINNGTAKPIQVRVTPEGNTVIEDGRHRLQAAKELGMDSYPIEDVSSKYAAEISPPKPQGDTVSGNAKRIEETALEKKLTDKMSDLPQYKSINMKEQAKKSIDLVTNDRQKAIDIIDGKANPPDGIHAQSIHQALEDVAIKEGNGELLTKLAQSHINTELSEGAQRLRIAAERDPHSPVELIRQIKDARAKVSKGKQSASKVKSEIKNIAEKAPKPTKETWSSFVKGLEC